MTRNISQSQKPNPSLKIQCFQVSNRSPYVSITRGSKTRCYYSPSLASIKRLQKAIYHRVVTKSWTMYPFISGAVGWTAAAKRSQEVTE